MTYGIPDYIFSIIASFSILSFIFFLCYKQVIRYWIKNALLFKILKIVFLWITPIMISLHFLVYMLGFNSMLIRRHGIETLKILSSKQKEYYKIHNNYANKFAELGCDPESVRDCLRSYYTFYMTDDRIFLPDYYPLDLPGFVKKRGNTIYAVGNIRVRNDKLDIISIDFEGNIHVIQSAAWWLPY